MKYGACYWQLQVAIQLNYKIITVNFISLYRALNLRASTKCLLWFNFQVPFEVRLLEEPTYNPKSIVKAIVGHNLILEKWSAAVITWEISTSYTSPRELTWTFPMASNNIYKHIHIGVLALCAVAGAWSITLCVASWCMLQKKNIC